MMRAVQTTTIYVLILALAVVAGAIMWGRGQFEAAGPLEQDTVVTVRAGDNLRDVTETLAEAGAISSPEIFRIGGRYGEYDRRLKFGEYNIPAGASMQNILELLVSGRGIQYQVTVPEGLTSWEVVELLKTQDILTGEVAEVPEEGSLAPNTYSVTRGSTRGALIKRMQTAQAANLDAAWENRAEDLPLKSKEEALILASIIEKETGVADERPQVASVFVNRLRKGMPLQTDPTVIYGITLGQGSLGRGLRRSELRRETPYNTYTIPGLPPTPIANPGKEAIEAALNPDSTPYIFFVADGTGGHAFAVTLQEHNANVRKWRAIEAQRQ